MFKKSHTALIAFGFAAALAGSFAPATAAPGETCYFGECRSAATPAAVPPSCPAAARTVARNGSWKALDVCGGAILVDEFNNDAKFAVLVSKDQIGLMLAYPNWEFRPGQQVQMTFEVDGEGFRGTATVDEKGMLVVDGNAVLLHHSECEGISSFDAGIRRSQAVVLSHRGDCAPNEPASRPFLSEFVDHVRKTCREGLIAQVPPMHPIVEVDDAESGSGLKVHPQLGGKPWVAR